MSETIVELEACRVDLSARTVRRTDGTVHDLTERESELLEFLVRHPSRVISRNELLASVWGFADSVVSRACDNAVRRLRTKIESDPSRPRHLVTAHGDGYRFEPLQLTLPGRTHVRLGDRRVELGRHIVTTSDGEVKLSSQEVALLGELAKAQGAVVARDTLKRRVWGHARGRALDTAIRRLRNKLEPEPAKPRWLLTSRGGGYRLVVSPDDVPAKDTSSLLGRRELLSELAAALEESHRVVLVGPGGIGKTSVARVAAGRWNGPVFWVDAASNRRSDDLVSSVASALDARLATTEPVERIGRILARFEGGLLVLDNLEQILDDAARLVRTWQRAAPSLRFLGTSRVRLGLDNERVFEVPRLDPDTGIELFVTRARQLSRTFSADRDRVGSVVEALEGSPLAIELAAARAPVLSLEALQDRLDDALDLLARPRADTERHRSLRASIEASWSLLDDAERRALLQLACFEAPFTLVDVEALLGGSGLELLHQLVEHSLVRSLPDHRAFALYMAIRSFARHQLDDCPDGRSFRESYLEHLAALGRPAHLARLERGDDPGIEHQDFAASELEAAARMALAERMLEHAALCTLGAAWSRARRGPFGPCIELARAVASDEATPPDLRARLHIAAARLLRMADRPAEALIAATSGLAVAGDVAMGDASSIGALALADLQRREEGAQWAERAAEHYGFAGRDGRAAWMRGKAMKFRMAQPEAINAEFRRALDQARQDGDFVLASSAALEVASHDRLADRPGLARRRFEEAIDTMKRARHPMLRVFLYQGLLPTLLDLGDHEAIDDAAADAMSLAARMGSRVDESLLLAYQGTSLALREQFEDAEALFSEGLDLAYRATRPIPVTVGYLLFRRAESWLAAGDAAGAAQLSQESVDCVVGLRPGAVARAEMLRAVALATLGQHPEAAVLAARATEGRGAPVSSTAIAVASARQGLVAWLGQDPQGAARHAAEAEAALVRSQSGPHGLAGVAVATLRRVMTSP